MSTHKDINNLSQEDLDQIDANVFVQEHQKSQHGEKVLHCFCGLPAIERVARKEGPNQGRRFVSCPKASVSRCNFFRWLDPINVSKLREMEEKMVNEATQTEM
jgi:hypothetical protein